MAASSGARNASQKIAKEDIRYLQRLRHALKIDDETYGDMKRSMGVESTTELTHKQFLELVRRIKRHGTETGTASWKPVHKSAKKSGMDKEPAEEKKPQLSKIEAQLADMKLPWSYADAIAKQMFRVQYVKWCDGRQLAAVIAALAKRQAKLERQESLGSREPAKTGKPGDERA